MWFMPRITGRRSCLPGRRREEERARGGGHGREASAPCARDVGAAAEVAGNLAAQVKFAGAPAGNANREMILLLQKISRQLEGLQASPPGRGDRPEEPAGGRQELAALFGQFLQAEKSSGGAQPQGGGDAATQAAAQALAQAQYELATELEASLQKLRQVIGESERLAGKISSLLGRENGSRQV